MFTVNEVPVKAVMTPSIKLDGVTEYAKRIRSPTPNAVALADKLVVNTFDPVPIKVDVEDVKPP